MLFIKKCTTDDSKQLAVLKKQLLEESYEDNPIDIAQLETRIEHFLKSGYQAVFFINKSSIIGYGLIKMNVYPYCLQDFFICKEYQKRGFGSRAFSRLLDYLCTNTLNIDTIRRNNMGIGFWKSLGFKPGKISAKKAEKS